MPCLLRNPLFPLFALLAACDAPPPSAAEDQMSLTGSCARHADCDSDVCDTYQPTGAGPGLCIPETSVIYVSSGCDPETADGSRGAPFCSIREAVLHVDEERSSIRVHPGNYMPFNVVGGRVAVYGPDDGGIASVTEEDAGGIRIDEGAQVVLDGLVVGRSARFALRCTGAPASGTSIEVRRSQLFSLSTTLASSDCDVRLDRVQVNGLHGALQLTNARYRITNSVFTGSSERAAISLSGSDGLFALNTVTGNSDPHVQAPAIQCLTRAVIEDSIVVGNAPAANGSQFAGDCVLRRTVVGSGDTIVSNGAIRKDPDLDGFELPRTPANLDCCIDRAARRPSIRHDLEGTPRPQGPRFDIGADEADPAAAM